MSNLPFHLLGHIATLADRNVFREENAQNIRDEVEAERIDFDERTMRLKALRTARDAELKIRQLARPIKLRPGPRRS
ncbi:hypothetical protein [Methylobacterium sp. J-077]|uniref:hypothetical protein n=1 Tax=Methylobacterium sp. J-077 TaxID=2836656 RepID=UPI001FB92A4B|nr:hypothetical protein [Methylobacterium sp. J-077]MCJ2125867.1 hypothetical protein [Methylobacterium sp. J-077]